MSLSQRLLRLPRSAKRAILISADSLLLPLAFYMAYRLKTGDLLVYEQSLLLLVAVPLISVPIFIRTGLYRAVIRYMGAKAFYTIVRGVTVSTLVLMALMAITAMEFMPFSVFGIYWTLACLYIGGSRLLVRDYFQERQNIENVRERVAVYGAGAAGVQLVNGLMAGKDYQPMVFVDEKSDLIGSIIKGIKVLSPKQLEQSIVTLGIKQVLLAIPSASRMRRRQILSQLEPLPVHVRTIPGLADLVSGVAQVDDIQEVDIADLLGRDPVPPDDLLLSKCIQDKVVMVTGAGGSIGAELCRQILQLRPKRLVLFESSEFALYNIEQELRVLQANLKDTIDKHTIELECVLGSVTHRRRVEAVLCSFEVQTIYHAAAYKHVPLVEHNPIEGVVNNLFGTWRSAEAAIAANVETFVLISTDKAVRPTNIMGATKRTAELVLQALARRQTHTTFCMVRFGNVLGSSGSVVPLFRSQLRQGGPLTVTHSEITRYFMTIPEAAQLVLQAGAMAEGGDVFVLDMGESVKISDLAKRMIMLSGLTIKNEDDPNGDIEIIFTGLRPGEKLFEELLIGDDVSGTEHPRIMRAKETEIDWLDLAAVLGSLEKGCAMFNSEKVRGILEATVAGYAPQCEVVDPVWKLLENHRDFDKITALPANVEELNPGRVIN